MRINNHQYYYELTEEENDDLRDVLEGWGGEDNVKTKKKKAKKKVPKKPNKKQTKKPKIPKIPKIPEGTPIDISDIPDRVKENMKELF